MLSSLTATAAAEPPFWSQAPHSAPDPHVSVTEQLFLKDAIAEGIFQAGSAIQAQNVELHIRNLEALPSVLSEDLNGGVDVATKLPQDWPLERQLEEAGSGSGEAGSGVPPPPSLPPPLPSPPPPLSSPPPLPSLPPPPPMTSPSPSPPPPPKPPPMPPQSPGFVIKRKVTQLYVIGGTVASFDQEAFKITLGSLTNVPPEKIELDVVAASVQVTATIITDSIQGTDSVIAALANIASSPLATVSALLEVSVVSIALPLEEVTSVESSPPPEGVGAPPPPEGGAPVGVIVGAAVGGLLVVALAVLVMKRVWSGTTKASRGHDKPYGQGGAQPYAPPYDPAGMANRPAAAQSTDRAQVSVGITPLAGARACRPEPTPLHSHGAASLPAPGPGTDQMSRTNAPLTIDDLNDLRKQHKVIPPRDQSPLFSGTTQSYPAPPRTSFGSPSHLAPFTPPRLSVPLALPYAPPISLHPSHAISYLIPACPTPPVSQEVKSQLRIYENEFFAKEGRKPVKQKDWGPVWDLFNEYTSLRQRIVAAEQSPLVSAKV